jgi:DNA-binding response OmpR family regulator
MTTKNKIILYAEDDPVVRLVYKNCLEKAGFQVICAQDGLETLKYLNTCEPDLVVLDLMMPRFSGEEVLKFICNDSRFHEKPLIILSNSSQVEKEYQDISGRADKYLVKYECTPAILLEKVQEIFAGPPLESSDGVNGSIEDSPIWRMFLKDKAGAAD